MSKDQELARQLFGPTQEQKSVGVLEAVKQAFQAIAPGLDAQKIAQDLGGELRRLGVQGTAELAAGLFGGSNAYVPPYGPGQHAPEAGLGGPAANDNRTQEQHQQERGGREL